MYSTCMYFYFTIKYINNKQKCNHFIVLFITTPSKQKKKEDIKDPIVIRTCIQSIFTSDHHYMLCRDTVVMAS
jgi:hypothetical protein